MEIKFNINKKYFLLVLIIFLVSGCFIIAIATTPNPGHQASEIGTGTTDTGLFTGNSVSVWRFPGEVRIGGSTTGDEGLLVLYPGDSGAWFGIKNDATNNGLALGWAGDTFNNYMILKGGPKVGIGTDNPVNKLDVEGGVVLGSGYSGSSTAPTNGLLVEGAVGIGTNSPSQKLHVAGNVFITGNLILAPGSSITVPGVATDQDNDGYILEGLVVPTQVIDPTGIHQSTTTGNDCLDTSNLVKPGQTQFIFGNLHGGDYNCDNNVEKQLVKYVYGSQVSGSSMSTVGNCDNIILTYVQCINSYEGSEPNCGSTITPTDKCQWSGSLNRCTGGYAQPYTVQGNCR